MVVIAAFVALFSRLWFLQVLASDNFQLLAEKNRVRIVRSEPLRGRILDRTGKVVLVQNRQSLSVTIEQETIDKPRRLSMVLERLSELLDVKKRDFQERLADITVSPYKPVVVANDVPKSAVTLIAQNSEDFPGVGIEERPVREYPQGSTAAHALGFVGEITADQLKQEPFKGARPRYEPGDLVGRGGVELVHDQLLRGKPRVERFFVNSAGSVVCSEDTRDGIGATLAPGEAPAPLSDPDDSLICNDSVTQEGEPGDDLVLSLDARIQKITERALAAGIRAARVSYQAPAGGAVVLDPNTGGVVSMATFPTYDPRVLANGFSLKDQKMLDGSPSPDDDRMFNRAIAAAVPPGSTFKTATAGAALATGVADISSLLPCPGSITYADQEFDNWTSVDYGSIGFPKSLEVSCDTFYYELGWRMETQFGPVFGDASERFQDYLRLTGFGHPTGIDLPGESPGNVPDEEWCEVLRRTNQGCLDGWLPGYSVNLSIGQGDIQASPLQMAVSYAALVNGGRVLQPRLAMRSVDLVDGKEQVTHEFPTREVAKLPLDEVEMGVLRQGLEDVVMGAEGTAAGAFAGFPLDRYPVAGKTGTAQIGDVDSGLNYAWFLSYAPADDPKYVVAVYLEKAGHGGESAAPVAREIYEGIFKLDNETEVNPASDASG